MDLVAVILAAGQGKRMQSDLPKVIVPVCGRPMVHYVLDALDAIGVERKLVVVGYRGDAVRAELAHRAGVEFIEQPEQLGTGHAVQVCRPALEGFDGATFVLAGDSPLVQPTSLRHLVEAFRERNLDCLLGTILKEDPTGLGRIVRDSEGRFTGIVEHRDATEEQRAIREVNMSTYVFRVPPLLAALEQLRNDNQQGEYYLTDCPRIMLAAGQAVDALACLSPSESLSINTPEQLARVEEEMRRLNYPATL